MSDVAKAFPAYAGMNRCIHWCNDRDSSVPRSRGDEPGFASDAPLDKAAFPAHAGMNRRGYSNTTRHTGVPRSRGDERERL